MRTHDTRMAKVTSYPLPVGSQLHPDLGFQAFTLDQVEIIMPPRKPRGRALTPSKKAANRRIARRCVRIEHLKSRVKHCRMVHDTCRPRKAGIRHLIMEVCCALDALATDGLIGMHPVDQSGRAGMARSSPGQKRLGCFPSNF